MKTEFRICQFNLAQTWDFENLPASLEAIISRGRKSYWKILRLLSQTIVSSVEHFAEENRDEEYSKAAAHLIEIFKDSNETPVLTNDELVIFKEFSTPCRPRRS